LDRDYKEGEDALLGQMYLSKPYGEMQLLYIPRRAVEDRTIQWEYSSLAGKYHVFLPDTEFELTLLASIHYQDTVIGIGSVGYLGNAAWRFDLTATHLHDEKENYLSSIMNLDYGWNWHGFNCYGWIEYYFNGLGERDKNYAITTIRPALKERLERSEIFISGRHYLDTQIKVELHPLVNLYVNTVNNITDPSGYIRPWLVWDMAINAQLNLASTLPWGGIDTEFGGVRIEGTHLTDRHPKEVQIWITLFFS